MKALLCGSVKLGRRIRFKINPANVKIDNARQEMPNSTADTTQSSFRPASLNACAMLFRFCAVPCCPQQRCLTRAAKREPQNVAIRSELRNLSKLVQERGLDVAIDTASTRRSGPPGDKRAESRPENGDAELIVADTSSL